MPLLDSSTDRLLDDMNDVNTKRAKIQEQMTKNETKLKNLVHVFGSGVFTEEECKAAAAEVRQKIAELNLQLVELHTPDDFIDLLSRAKTAVKRLSFTYSISQQP